MSIESLNKNELVKEVRKLTQENKLLEASLSELTTSIDTVGNSLNGDNNDDVAVSKELPYLAVSIVKQSSDKHRVIQVRFDLDGNAKVDFSKEKVEKEGYRAGYEAAKLMETIVANQEEPVTVKLPDIKNKKAETADDQE
jgi:DNA integrity scanning protein DisA with diadenylate cyclase activity